MGDKVKTPAFHLSYSYVKNKSAADILFDVWCLVAALGGFLGFLFLVFFSFLIIMKNRTNTVSQAIPFIKFELFC